MKDTTEEIIEIRKLLDSVISWGDRRDKVKKIEIVYQSIPVSTIECMNTPNVIKPRIIIEFF